MNRIAMVPKRPFEILFEFLTDQGPPSASKLREQIFERHPNAYTSADTLWKSTVQRLYEEALGFAKPEYGTYAFTSE